MTLRRGRRRPGRAAVAAALLCAGLTACTADPAGPGPGSSSSPTTPETPAAADATELAVAVSEPSEDSLYPEVGDPGVDALHYDLDLAWDPTTDTLTGSQVLLLRATETADSLRLDLGRPLTVSGVTLDGEPVEHEHRGKDLVVDAPVVADGRYELALDYEGTPAPVAAPTTRDDIPGLGFTIDDEHQVWTMQEPYGAHTWYAVNDHPSDKALYDFTLTVPSPWTGVANGLQTSSVDDGATTTTTYSLDAPAASYLVTVAFGDYVRTDDEGPGGLPITYWTPRDRDDLPARLATTPAAIAWLEERLGPYPFASAGIVVVDSDSGMETQTMITLGDTDYSTSPAVVVHELAHQWWGDQVTPDDWRDLWMNEGMAMYLQLLWEAEQEGVAPDRYLDRFRGLEAEQRLLAGPPGAFDPARFGEGNVYYGPALMWHELRGMIGDEQFFAVARGWPLAQDDTSTGREALMAFVEAETGRDLDAFWDGWLLGETTPR